ncbi:MAG: Phosphotransferase enzyme family, partial [Candidatus Saccharibacteria bacterium]|nr:Phosphotransferase enzyme family [Candidatus Saccharibacteria bacterium]
MYSRIVPDVATKYELDVLQIGDVQKGYRNESYPLELANGTEVNLLFYKREPGILERIKTADLVADHAASKGLPVRTRYDNRLLMVGESFAGVYHYLQGTTISWESYTKRHIKLLGWAMADLHVAMEDLSGTGPFQSDELGGLVARMKHYFSSNDIQQATSSKLDIFVDPALFDSYSELIERTRALPGQQYLHMDMVRGNVLFDNVAANARWQIDDIRLSGIIDFEKASYGLPIYDIARTLAFLLVDCPKPRDKIYKYFIDSGYRKRGQNDVRHIELLPYFIRLFLLHDFYKFLRHTPYESLHDNYHYSRTRDLLKDYG